MRGIILITINHVYPIVVIYSSVSGIKSAKCRVLRASWKQPNP